MIRQKTIDVYERTYKFNTIISAAMETFNAISKTTNINIWREGYDAIIKAIVPISPNIDKFF